MIDNTADVRRAGLDNIWRTSTRTMDNGNCIEVRRLDDGTVEVRDSKDRSGPVLQFTTSQWHRWISLISEDRL